MELSLLFSLKSVSHSLFLSTSYIQTHMQADLYAWRNFISSPLQNTDPSSYVYMPANRFRGTSSTFARTHCYRFLSVGTLKSIAYSAHIENGKKLGQRINDACQSIRSCPGTRGEVRQFMISRVFINLTFMNPCIAIQT
jgi:hypothetical protein